MASQKRRNDRSGAIRQGDKSSSRRIRELETMLQQNAVAVQSGPTKKSWHKTDMKIIRPKTINQGAAFESWFRTTDGHLAMLGSAGTGKSFLAIAMAMADILDPNCPQDRLLIVRGAVPTRQIGALPGTREEKTQPVFEVYKSIFAELFGKPNTLTDMVDAGVVQLIDTSYIRGATWNNAIVIVDEITSMNDHEVDTVMTRIGEDTRLIIAGDQKQSDLVTTSNRNDKHNYQQFIDTIERIPTIDVVKFTHEDIVRSGFVKSWIVARDSI